MADIELFDLRSAVGHKLQILPNGQILSAEDGEKIERAALAVQAQLSTLDIAEFDIENGLESRYLDPFVDMVAATLVDEYGLPAGERDRIRGEGLLSTTPRSQAERRMRLLVGGKTAKLSVKVC